MKNKMRTAKGFVEEPSGKSRVRCPTCGSGTAIYWLLSIYAAVLLSRTAGGQSLTSQPDSIIANATQTPREGVGHDYIHDLDETVNPQNGQLSVRITGPNILERGSNYPHYVYMYDTSGRLAMGGNATLSGCYAIDEGVNITCAAQVGFGSFTASQSLAFGNGEGVPEFPFQQPSLGSIHFVNLTEKFNPIVPGDPNSGGANSDPSYYCNHVSIDSFIDRTGGIHSLNMQYVEPLQAGEIHDGCSGIWGVGTVLGGGDTSYKGICTGTTSSACSPVVADSHGNVFAGQMLYSDTFPQNSEDTNGNSPDGSGRSWSYNMQNIANSYSPILGVGSGDSGAGTLAVPATMNVPGVEGAYTYHYKAFTRSASPDLNTGIVTSVSSGDCTVNSAASEAQSTSFLETSSISLPPSATYPDGLQYSLGYDSTWGLLNSITYPNGATVTYTWNKQPQSEYANVVSPSQWKTFGLLGSNPNANCYFWQDIPVVESRVVSFDGVTPALRQDFMYSTIAGSNGFWSSKQTTVTTTDLLRADTPKAITIYNYIPIPVYQPLWVKTQGVLAVEDKIVYEDGSGRILKTVKKIWNGPDSLAAECTILDNGFVSGTFYQYQTGNVSPYLVTDQVIDTLEYGYSQGVSASCIQPAPSVIPMRETKVQYSATPNTPLWQPGSDVSLIAQTNDRPQTIQVYNYGTLISETDVSYDETTTSDVSKPVYGHDEINFGTSQVTGRGNSTTVRKKCFPSCQDAISTLQYDKTGQILSVVDPNGNAPGASASAHTTTLSYEDDYSADGQPPTNPANGQPWATNTYVTKITPPSTNGQSHVETFKYDYAFGELTQSTDENTQITKFTYADVWGRPTLASMPDLGQATITYGDSGSNPYVATATLMNSSTGQTGRAKLVMDGAGHVIERQTTAPEGTLETDTQYDGYGRALSVSNPYLTASGPAPVTTYSYDPLGRTLFKCNQDNGSGAAPCVSSGTTGTSFAQWTFAGNVTTFTNENGNQWQQTSDSLGRLIEVREPDGAGGSPMETDYSYDVLGNLVSVTQNGASGSTARVRNFSYDSLSRLLCASNPENSYASCPSTSTGSYLSGTTGYTYDANGNVATKVSPAVNLSHATQTIGYCYDALNRTTAKLLVAPNPSNCSNPTSLQSSGQMLGLYAYDSSSASGAQNTVGRLTDEKSYAGVTLVGERQLFAYDPMGRLSNEVQFNYLGPTGGYPIAYQYDLAGNQTYLANPVGAGGQALNLTYNYDAASRLNSIVSDTSSNTTGTWPSLPSSLFTTNTTNGYWPFGGLQSWCLGMSTCTSTSPFTVNQTFGPRLWVNSITATGEVP
jgi:YD repeat-containing protein